MDSELLSSIRSSRGAKGLKPSCALTRRLTNFVNFRAAAAKRKRSFCRATAGQRVAGRRTELEAQLTEGHRADSLRAGFARSLAARATASKLGKLPAHFTCAGDSVMGACFQSCWKRSRGRGAWSLAACTT